jgi:hypothetical protein
MNAIQDDPETLELERALILWLIATGDLAAHVARERGSAPDRWRIVLDILDTRLGQARAAAEDAVATTLFSHP